MIKILVVDDEELICQGIKSMLERLDNLDIERVFMAYDGEEGLQIYKDFNPEIIITDVRMPGVNGIEMIKALRGMKASVKIIILSGYSDFEYAKEALRLGALDYLLKPASMTELRHVVEKAVEKLSSETASVKENMQKKEEVNEAFEDHGEKTVVGFAKKYIKDNFSKDIDMAVISNMVSMNYSYFSKLFKDATGVKFTDYLISVRMEEAKRLLDNACVRIGEVAVKVGYPNPKHFTRAFKNYYGVSPEQYRKGN